MLADTNTQQSESALFDESAWRDALAATEEVYRTLAEEGGHNPEEVHRLKLCYEAAALLVSDLISNGRKVKHEIRSIPGMTEHSYVVVDDPQNEIIIDPMWQQFVPIDKVSPDMPRVLIGTRGSVAAQAQHFGVDETTAQIWSKDATSMTVAEQQQADRAAKRAADEAEAGGAWERFAAQNR